MAHTEIELVMKELSLKYVPIAHQGTFAEIITPKPYFVTTIPTLYDLPEIKRNLAEGYVIKTNQRTKYDVNRPIYKIKNMKSFGERN